ncbi:major capsid protein [Endozoicomonas acroporae]|uniref:major capsid protein n=1 Tax=Endozoicomonas acroporae TaxID=1701104 RepID=UPI003D79D2B6
MKKLKHLALLLATSAMASSAFAEIDVSAATTALTTDGSAAITAVGTALVGLALPWCSSGSKARCSAETCLNGLAGGLSSRLYDHGWSV